MKKFYNLGRSLFTGIDDLNSVELSVHSYGNKLGNTFDNVNTVLCKTYEVIFHSLSESVVSEVASM